MMTMKYFFFGIIILIQLWLLELPYSMTCIGFQKLGDMLWKLVLIVDILIIARLFFKTSKVDIFFYYGLLLFIPSIYSAILVNIMGL